MILLSVFSNKGATSAADGRGLNWGNFSFPADLICTSMSRVVDLNVKTMKTAGEAASGARARNRGDKINREKAGDRWFLPHSDSKVVVWVEDQRRHAEWWQSVTLVSFVRSKLQHIWKKKKKRGCNPATFCLHSRWSSYLLTLNLALSNLTGKKNAEMAFCFFSTVALSYTFLTIHFSIYEKVQVTVKWNTDTCSIVSQCK